MSNTKPKPLIAFIDDDEEGGPMEFYDEALKDEGFDVRRIQSCIKAVEYIQTTDERPALWLIDLMMPVENEDYRVPGETETLFKAASLGLASGRVLYRQIRKRFPIDKIIMFTHMSTPEILDDLEEEMDLNASCEAKMALMPSDLVELINIRLNEHASNS